METNNFIIINNENNIISNKIENEYIVLLNYNKYIEEIYNSYQNNNINVYNQFNKDFPRANYNINHINENKISLFTDYFEFFIYQYDYNYFEFLMLCTQAVMGSPLEILYNIIYNTNNINHTTNINDTTKEYYIGEIKTTKNKNKNKKLVFNIINNNNNNLSIIIKKNLRIFYINTYGKDITLYYVNIKLNIPYSTKEKIIITYKILKNK